MQGIRLEDGQQVVGMTRVSQALMDTLYAEEGEEEKGPEQDGAAGAEGPWVVLVSSLGKGAQACVV